eukprot:gene42781-52275_t
MNRAALRRFEFFDVDTISEDISATLGCVPTCAVAEGGMLIFGDDIGNILFADQDFRVSDRRSKIFKGKIRGLAYLLDPLQSNRQYIVALGDDFRTGELPLQAIKVYIASDLSRPLYVINVTSGDSNVTSFAVLGDGNEIAVGYSNGRVLLYLWPFFRDSTQSRSAIPPPIVLLEKHSYPVAALHFCDTTPLLSPTQVDHVVRLFITLETKQVTVETEADMIASMIEEDDIEHAGIIVFDTSFTLPSTAGYPSSASLPPTPPLFTPHRDPKALDSRGSGALNVSYMRVGGVGGELVVGRPEGVCTYTVDDRGGAMAVFGEKLALCSVGRYALVVSVEDKSGGTANAATTGSTKRKPQVNIYDIRNKIICGTFRRVYVPSSDRVLMT